MRGNETGILCTYRRLNMRADWDVCYDYEYRYVDDFIGASKLVFYVYVV